MSFKNIFGGREPEVATPGSQRTDSPRTNPTVTTYETYADGAVGYQASALSLQLQPVSVLPGYENFVRTQAPLRLLKFTPVRMCSAHRCALNHPSGW